MSTCLCAIYEYCQHCNPGKFKGDEVSINDRDEPANPAFRDTEHSIVTFTGKRVWPLDPQVEDIDIRDIAHALANSCRFTGHVRQFYSVAQHCVLASEHVLDKKHALAALLHDASEAYLSDIARPVKRQAGFTFYREVEARLESVIAGRFGMDYPFHRQVKDIDTRLLITEQRDLMPKSSAHGWPKLVRPLGDKIEPWEPRTAEKQYLERFVLLTAGVTAYVTVE